MIQPGWVGPWPSPVKIPPFGSILGIAFAFSLVCTLTFLTLSSEWTAPWLAHLEACWVNVHRSTFLELLCLKYLIHILHLIYYLSGYKVLERKWSFLYSLSLVFSTQCCWWEDQAILYPSHFCVAGPLTLEVCSIFSLFIGSERLDDLIWYWFIFIHCAGYLVGSFNMETHVLPFEKCFLSEFVAHLPFNSPVSISGKLIFGYLLPGWVSNFLIFSFLYSIF